MNVSHLGGHIADAVGAVARVDLLLSSHRKTGAREESASGRSRAHLGDLVVNAVGAVADVVLFLDLGEHAAADAHHPQKLVDVVARVPVEKES